MLTLNTQAHCNSLLNKVPIHSKNIHTLNMVLCYRHAKTMLNLASSLEEWKNYATNLSGPGASLFQCDN